MVQKPVSKFAAIRALRRATPLTACLALTFGATACGSDDDGADDSDTPTEATEVASTEVQGDLDAVQAADAALLLTPGFVFEIDRDDDDGRSVWDVGISDDNGSGIEQTIDATNGEGIEQQTATVPPEAATPPAVTVQEAIGIAVDTVPDGTVVEADLGTENSTVVWEIKVQQSGGGDVELEIDAATGTVVGNDVDD